jgi:hypothetical protein
MKYEDDGYFDIPNFTLYEEERRRLLGMVLYVIDKQKKGNCMQTINPKL